MKRRARECLRERERDTNVRWVAIRYPRLFLFLCFCVSLSCLMSLTASFIFYYLFFLYFWFSMFVSLSCLTALEE